MQKPIVVAVSGGFDPVHIGHIHFFRDARALGDKLIVILNDDEWLKRKKGYIFMPEKERKEVLESIRWVDEVVIREPRETYDVCHMIEKLPIDIFANGGDRNPETGDARETVMCAALNIKLIFGVGGSEKPQSSTWLIKNLANQVADWTKLRETGKAV